MQLRWDTQGARRFQTGVDRGVLYLKGNNGFNDAYPWNGLVNVTDSPSGAEPTPLYADDIKYLNLLSMEDFAYTIEAYTFPDAFAKCDGSYEVGEGVYAHQQERVPFGFCYRTMIGDETGAYIGYILHLIYNGTATVSERSYTSLSDSMDPGTMSWEISTIPAEIPGFLPSAWVEINSLKANPRKLKAVEDILYGTYNEDARLPMPDEIIELFYDHAIYPSSILYPAATVFPQDI